MSDLSKAYLTGLLMGTGAGLVFSSAMDLTGTLLGLSVQMVAFGLIMIWFGLKRHTEHT